MTPIFVNRATAAALCSISVDTFDNWRRREGFPPPAFTREGRHFWKWADIEQHLAGAAELTDDQSAPSLFQKALHAKGPHRARP
jgi:hypothetical protein